MNRPVNEGTFAAESNDRRACLYIWRGADACLNIGIDRTISVKGPALEDFFVDIALSLGSSKREETYIFSVMLAPQGGRECGGFPSFPGLVFENGGCSAHVSGGASLRGTRLSRQRGTSLSRRGVPRHLFVHEMTEAQQGISLRGITKRFGSSIAVNDVDLEVNRGEFFTMLGPSGSGKTTLLRLIAGFEVPDAGSISLHGVDVTGLPPYQRDVNTVFQDYALFPHFDVAQNVAYGLRVQRVPKNERDEAGAGGARDGADERLREASSRATVRRPTPASRLGEGHRERARSPPP